MNRVQKIHPEEKRKKRCKNVTLYSEILNETMSVIGDYHRRFEEKHLKKKKFPGIKSEIPHLDSKRRRSTKNSICAPFSPIPPTRTRPVFTSRTLDQKSPSLSPSVQKKKKKEKRRKKREKKRERVPARRYSIPANGIPIGGTVISGRARSRTDWPRSGLFLSFRRAFHPLSVSRERASLPVPGFRALFK